MTDSSAIMFEFSDENSASLANELLQELGYDPVRHNANSMHIHVEGQDLTSALEIAQSHGGQLVEQAAIGADAISDSTYAMDAITIPAHVVNEDWIESEGLHNRDADQSFNGDVLPDAENHSYFSGDVHT